VSKLHPVYVVHGRIGLYRPLHVRVRRGAFRLCGDLMM
jgi:hypothetical protein